jgi:hypothetical protein
MAILLAAGVCGCFAQESRTDGRGDTARFTVYRIEASGTLATGGQAPFWMTSNRYGRTPAEAHGGGLLAGVFHVQPQGRGGWAWQAGLDVAAVTPRYRAVYLHQLYATVAFRSLHASVGSREGGSQSLLNTRLSSGDMVESTNARPLPEVSLYVPRFTALPLTGGWVEGKGNFAVGRSLDAAYLRTVIRPELPYIRDMLWHRKSVHLRVQDPRGVLPAALTLGLRHAAQWGGVSTNPEAAVRVQPRSFRDFLRTVLGKAGDERASASAQINVLGNHCGAYDFHLACRGQEVDAAFYCQHYFDDASGMEFKNGTDGLWGLQFDFPERAVCRSLVLEYLVTLDQSGAFHFIVFDHDRYPGYGGGGDDYYNNTEYTTGYAHFNRSAGSPLLLSPLYNRDGTPGFRHNRLRAWHLGLDGRATKELSFRLLLTRLESFGKPYAPTLKMMTAHFFGLDLHWQARNGWMFSASLAADRGNLTGNHAGIGLSITRLLKYGY